MPEVEVLLDQITVDIVELHEMESSDLVAYVEKREMPVVGDDIAASSLQMRERLVEKIDSSDDA